jgi:uncharacterized membrane protein (DUF485 family)
MQYKRREDDITFSVFYEKKYSMKVQCVVFCITVFLIAILLPLFKGGALNLDLIGRALIVASVSEALWWGMMR